MTIGDADIFNKQPETFRLYRENGRSDYLFVHFRSPATVWVEGGYADVEAGDCILFGRHEKQSYHPRKGLCFLHDYLHFDTETMEEEVLVRAIPRGAVFRTSPEALAAASEIAKELKSGLPRYRAKTLSALGNLFLCRVAAGQEYAAAQERKRNHADTLLALREAVYREPQKPWTVERLAHRACMSRSGLQHLYKAYFGVSCMEDVIAARIGLSKTYLLSGDLTVGQIAEKCGYQSTPHFIRQFRSVVGVTPEKFRNS